MKNKKGFTIVELVIVIAVIAILAGVLIPTFSGVVEKANLSAAYQNARNEYSMYVAYCAETGDAIQDGYVQVTKGNKEYWFKIEDGALNSNKEASKPSDLANQDALDLTTSKVMSKTIVSPVDTLGLAANQKIYATSNCDARYEVKMPTTAPTKSTDKVTVNGKDVLKAVEATAEEKYEKGNEIFVKSSNTNDYDGETKLVKGTDYERTSTGEFTTKYTILEGDKAIIGEVKKEATYKYQYQAGTYYYIETIAEAFGNSDVKIYAIQ